MRLLIGFLGAMMIFNASVIASDIRYDKSDRRDPFVSLVNAEGVVSSKGLNTGDIRIEGIIYDASGGSMVLINGDFYKQGDSVNGANVISIFRDHVILSKSDQEKTLWIREETVNTGDDNAPSQKAAQHATQKKK